MAASARSSSISRSGAQRPCRPRGGRPASGVVWRKAAKVRNPSVRYTSFTASAVKPPSRQNRPRSAPSWQGRERPGGGGSGAVRQNVGK